MTLRIQKSKPIILSSSLNFLNKIWFLVSLSWPSLLGCAAHQRTWLSSNLLMRTKNGICLSNINIIMQHRYRTSGFILKLHIDKVVPAVCSSHCLHITNRPHKVNNQHIIFYILLYVVIYLCVCFILNLYDVMTDYANTMPLCQYFWSDNLLSVVISVVGGITFIGKLLMSSSPFYTAAIL